MPFGTRDNSKLDAFSKVLRSTAGALLEGEVKRAEISRKQRDEAGVAQELDAYRSALTGASDPIRIFDQTLQTTSRLNRYGQAGQTAASQVFKVAELWKDMRPPVVKPVEPKTFARRGPIQTAGKDRYQVVDEVEEGTGVVRKSTTQHLGSESSDGGGKSEEEKLKILDKQKRGLERELRRKYPTMNLHKVLLNEEEVPMVGRVTEKYVNPKSQAAEERVVKEGQQDPAVLKWVNLIAQIETEMQARGMEYTPADQFALSQTNKPAAPPPAAAPAPAQSASLKYKSQDEFTAAFRKFVKQKTGVERNPTATEIEKAKGKYF